MVILAIFLLGFIYLLINFYHSIDPHYQGLYERYSKVKVHEGGPTVKEMIRRHIQWFDKEGDLKYMLEWDPEIDPYVFKNGRLDSIRSSDSHRILMQAGDPDTW